MMKKKIRIRRVSSLSIGLTVVLAVLFFFIAIEGDREFLILKTSTDDYIACENAARQLQEASSYLTEQVRMYTMTGDTAYRDLYFDEATVSKRREHALADLKIYFDDTSAFTSLEVALNSSKQLMQTEYYAMRLVAEATGDDPSNWPDELRNLALSTEDAALSDADKLTRAQQMVSDSSYLSSCEEISSHVTSCLNDLVQMTKNKQGRATTVFSDMYLKLEIGIVIFVVLILGISIIMRRLIVRPLVSYNDSIKRGEIFPVIGADELQNLATTYNKIYQDNQETQRLIRHQAEHDALTDVLNRGSFDRILHIYDTGSVPFALILIDVDIFKHVNDTYGHAAGDEILKRVASLLKTAFRTIDYICRIGGDEFAIVMVDMTSGLQYTIQDKIDAINDELAHPAEGLPAVSLSVGVAFSDRDNPGDSIFKDADKALYVVKEQGRNGCHFY